MRTDRAYRTVSHKYLGCSERRMAIDVIVESKAT